MSSVHTTPSLTIVGLFLSALSLAGPAAPRPSGSLASVQARLSEWKIELSEGTLAAGTVTFTVTNAGTVPHAFEVEGQGIEKETAVIQPGASAALTLTLKPGTYEVYCPVGQDSHRDAWHGHSPSRRREAFRPVRIR